MRGAQDISQAWMDLAQDRMQRAAEGMRALASCRTPADLIRVQNEPRKGRDGTDDRHQSAGADVMRVMRK